MREIKFRAWDKERKEWQYFTLSQLAQGSTSLIWTKLENWCEFTGLKDKNGKEIYEGDIVKWCTGYKTIVEYKETEFDDGDCIGFAIHSNCEVIGNIYENPELLEEKK